jgi:hypothetical protein
VQKQLAMQCPALERHDRILKESLENAKCIKYIFRRGGIDCGLKKQDFDICFSTDFGQPAVTHLKRSCWKMVCVMIYQHCYESLSR